VDNSMDDFEMKPLTSGLGFQKKAAEVKRTMQRRQLPVAPPPAGLEAASQPRSSHEILGEIRQALKPLQTDIKLSSTLPRPGEKVRVTSSVGAAVSAASASALGLFAGEPETHKTPMREPDRRRDPVAEIPFQVPAQDFTRRGASDALIRPLVPISVSAAAAVVDAIIVMALSMLFVATLVSVTGISVGAVMTSAQADGAAQLALGVLVISVLQIYLILARSFYGRTLGEWTFDVQLGEDQQIESALYPLKVLLRSFVNMISGFVILPIFSAILGKDLAGQITGVRLYRRNLA
jgi:hypothetical protein